MKLAIRETCWLALLCLVSVAVACGTPSATPTATPAPGTLRVEVTPAGATVSLNGVAKGCAPLTLELPAGTYALRMQSEGYAPLQRTVEVQSGEQTLVTDALRDIAAPAIVCDRLPAALEAGRPLTITAQATDNLAVTHMRLWIDGQLVAETGGAALSYVWDTQAATVGTHVITLQAEDAAGNSGQERHNMVLQASPTPRPSPTPTAQQAAASSELSVRESSITLLAYPYEAYLHEGVDARYNFAFRRLDRAAYTAASPQPQPRSFKAVVLENRYLRLTFLPELGGRLYQCLFKPGGKNIFYQNAVLKPSYWGPLSRDENWWLAVGGMEWALPVNEHGYEWGQPWTYKIERKAHEVSIVLQDSTAQERLRAEVRVTLPEGCAYFLVQPRLVNPTSQAIACQFWINAALTLGSASASRNTDFICPTQSMLVHSTGDGSLPGEKQSMAWPVYNGRDFSRYGNWKNWLGVFVPDVQQDYTGAYNHDTGLGIARVFPHEIARGLKLFAFGSDFPARGEYCDDGSDYFELWGGPSRTFWPEDDVVIGAGQALQWSEVWLPFQGIGGLDVANAAAALKVSVQGDRLELGIAAGKPGQVQIRLTWNAQEIQRQSAYVAPERPLRLAVPLAGASLPGQLQVQVRDERGASLLEYSKTFGL